MHRLWGRCTSLDVSSPGQELGDGGKAGGYTASEGRGKEKPSWEKRRQGREKGGLQLGPLGMTSFTSQWDGTVTVRKVIETESHFRSPLRLIVPSVLFRSPDGVYHPAFEEKKTQLLLFILTTSTSSPQLIFWIHVFSPCWKDETTLVFCLLTSVPM